MHNAKTHNQTQQPLFKQFKVKLLVFKSRRAARALVRWPGSLRVARDERVHRHSGGACELHTHIFALSPASICKSTVPSQR